MVKPPNHVYADFKAQPSSDGAGKFGVKQRPIAENIQNMINAAAHRLTVAVELGSAFPVHTRIGGIANAIIQEM